MNLHINFSAKRTVPILTRRQGENGVAQKIAQINFRLCVSPCHSGSVFQNSQMAINYYWLVSPSKWKKVNLRPVWNTD